MFEGKLITVWSSRGNMGTTFTSINLAKTISKYNERVVLVDLNLIQPRVAEYLSITDMNHTIDNLYPFAIGKNLTKELIEANCEEVDGLFILKGTLNPSFTDFVSPDILDSIIQSLKENFNYIILDVHSSLNNSGTYVALQHSDEIYTLLHRDLFSVLSLHDMKPFIFKIFNKDKFKVVFNRDSEQVFMPSEEVLDTLNMSSIATLPLMNNCYNYVNKGEFKKLEGKKESKAYFNAMDELVREKVIKNDSIKKIKKKKIFNIFG